MNTYETALSRSEPVVVPVTAGRGVLQRKCACGTHTPAGADCAACSKKGGGEALRRSSNGRAHDGGVPEAVHEVVNSPGRPLDAATRSFMESRFAHDFSGVRVHTDARASESAEAVNAHAYTLGRHIAFGAGLYAPETAEGRRLLGHELTHVVQQAGAPGASLSGAHAEREADENGYGLAAGRPALRASAAPAGTLQLEEKKEPPKPSTEVSGEQKGTKKGEETFTAKAEATLPLSDELSFGSLAFLDSLKLTGSSDVTGKPLGLTTLSGDFKMKMALSLMKLQLDSVKSKEDALKKGKLSFGTTLGTSGLLTLPFDKFDPSGSLGLTLDAKAAATTPSLIPSRRGKLTFGASLSTGGSLTHDLTSTKSTVAPKAESKLGLAFDFESAASGNRFMTMGGALGDKARLTAGLEAGASGSLTPEKAGGGLNFGASLGLTGTRRGVERFVKIQFTTDVTANYELGTATTKTETAFLGLITTGFKFAGPGDRKK